MAFMFEREDIIIPGPLSVWNGYGCHPDWIQVGGEALTLVVETAAAVVTPKSRSVGDEMGAINHPCLGRIAAELQLWKHHEAHKKIYSDTWTCFADKPSSQFMTQVMESTHCLLLGCFAKRETGKDSTSSTTLS